MKFNGTVNQHYVSQAELRFSSINPDADRKSRKIYQLPVLDRETYKLGNAKRVGIANVCSYEHLFSFGFSKEGFINLEQLFGVHEVDGVALTEKVINRDYVDVDDCFSVMQKLFCLKWLNFFRNPYGIKQVLSFFSMFSNLHPTSEQLREVFEKINKSTMRQRAHIATKYNVTPEDYENWLKMLFLLLMDVGEGKNFLIDVVKRMFCESHIFVYALVCTYSSEVCVISDRGCVILEGDLESTSYAFNLTKNSFIAFSLVDMSKFSPLSADGRIERIVENRLNMQIDYCHDNFELLAGYNRHSIYQCFSNVYSSERDPSKLMTV